MLGRIRDYARKHEQETIAQMTPFGSSRWDRESSLRQRQEKEQLERKLLQKLCSALEKAETEKKAFSEERERGMVWKWPFPSPEMAAELPEQKEGAPAEEASDGDLDPGQRAADVEGDRKDEKKGR